MNVLLDTHTFLWWNIGDSQLSEQARTIISDSRNQIYLSAASAWEIAIKYGKGRLELPEAADKYVANRINHYQFMALPIEVSHATYVHDLPPIHNDPFDRLLIAQSRLEKLPLLSADSVFAEYDVDVVW